MGSTKVDLNTENSNTFVFKILKGTRRQIN